MQAKEEEFSGISNIALPCALTVVYVVYILCVHLGGKKINAQNVNKVK